MPAHQTYPYASAVLRCYYHDIPAIRDGLKSDLAHCREQIVRLNQQLAGELPSIGVASTSGMESSNRIADTTSRLAIYDSKTQRDWRKELGGMTTWETDLTAQLAELSRFSQHVGIALSLLKSRSPSRHTVIVALCSANQSPDGIADNLCCCKRNVNLKISAGLQQLTVYFSRNLTPDHFPHSRESDWFPRPR